MERPISAAAAADDDDDEQPAVSNTQVNLANRLFAFK